MNTQNIRNTEKYLTIMTMFNDLLITFQQSEDGHSDQIFKKSEFFQEALNMFQEDSTDISLLIFALPGLIVRQKIDEIKEIYIKIQNTICTKWDSYAPNHLDNPDYLFLRLQDINKLDRLVPLLNEYIALSDNSQTTLKHLHSNNLDGEIIEEILNSNKDIETIYELVSTIISSMNKINLFITRVVNTVDNPDIKDLYQEAKTTTNTLENITNILIEIISKLKQRLAKLNQEDIVEEDKKLDIGESTTDNKIVNIIKLVKSLEHKSEDHMLVLALKYVIKNFNINNRLMMQRMLSDTDYSTMVDIILKDHETKPTNK